MSVSFKGSLKVWKYPLPEHVEMDPLVGTFLKLPSNEPVNVLARVYVIKVHNQILAVTRQDNAPVAWNGNLCKTSVLLKLFMLKLL